MIALRRFMIGRIVVLAAAVLLCLPMVARAEEPVKGATLGRRQLGLATFGDRRRRRRADGVGRRARHRCRRPESPEPGAAVAQGKEAQDVGAWTSTDEAPAARRRSWRRGTTSRTAGGRRRVSGSEAAGGDEERSAAAAPRARQAGGGCGRGHRGVGGAGRTTFRRPLARAVALGGRRFTRDLQVQRSGHAGASRIPAAVRSGGGGGPGVVRSPLLMQGPGANIGIVGQFEQLLGTASTLTAERAVPGGATFPTSMHESRWAPLPGAGCLPWQIGIEVTGGEHAFRFRVAAERIAINFPFRTRSTVSRGQAGRPLCRDARVLPLGRTRLPLRDRRRSHQRRLPHRTVAAVDADVGAAYAITRSIEVRLQGGVRRYFYDMHSVRGDRTIAGGGSTSLCRGRRCSR